MSFNKRYLNEDGIVANKHDIINYLSKPDALIIMDEFSDVIYKMFNDDVPEEELVKYIETKIDGNG